MDTLRGAFDSDEPTDARSFEEEALADRIEDAREPEVEDIRPPNIGTDERRMQVRAYNHWASLLGDRTFPSIEDLDESGLPEFGPHAVVLDFSQGIEDPIVRFLGDELGAECGAVGVIDRLSDVPPRSLLSRITDHYMQILANQAPIGFEAEFVNLRGVSILYRGILLPLSSDDETIDFICGVINWKEVADAQTADELLLEIDQAIEADELAERELEPVRHHADAMIDWADSPAHEPAQEEAPEETSEDAEYAAEEHEHESAEAAPASPDFDQYGLDDFDEDEEYGEEEDSTASYSFASLSDYIEAPAKKAVDLDVEGYEPAPETEFEADDAPVEHIDRFGRDGFEPSFDDADHAAEPVGEQPFDLTDAPSEPEELAEDAALVEFLASARRLAERANASEDRSRQALYDAVGRAYDFSLAAENAPAEYESLIEESGLSVQERAPMTPIVKLVFGSDYDKTRLTEYAAVLQHAHRIELERGALAGYLAEAEGGLKGVVKAERRLRREESGKAPVAERELREALAEKLRELEALTFEAIEAVGPEFALVMVRRDGNGEVSVLGEIDEDVSLVERAAKRLIG